MHSHKKEGGNRENQGNEMNKYLRVANGQSCSIVGRTKSYGCNSSFTVLNT
jgi:hypothetical protein